MFTLQVMASGRVGWVDVETSRSLEVLYLRLNAEAWEHERRDDFVRLLRAGEVVYQSVSPDDFRAWFGLHYTKRARCAAALGMTTRNLARYLSGEARLPWSTWVTVNALTRADGGGPCAS